ncbi:MAG: ABC transporter permease [Bdellovibrionaceae bacterium]|nr:ABC transporter permease [Pseudobdellovibrionaceae bacterium]
METDINNTSNPNAALSQSKIAELETAQSFYRMVYNQFKENKAALFGLFTIIFFVLVAVGAPVIEWALSVDANTQNVFNRYKPPFSSVQASQDVRDQMVQTFYLKSPNLAKDIEAQLLAKNLVQPIRPEDAMYDWVNLPSDKAIEAMKQINTPVQSDLIKSVKNFNSYHVFGTDELGRDVLMRLVYGTQVSMGVGVLVAIVSAFIGLLVGALAGYYGGMIDTVLMRTTDALLSLPLLPVLVVIAAIDLQKVPFLSSITQYGNESIIKLVFILCLFSWMVVARLVRGSILSLREREFILAAKTLGATDATIIIRHMFPNVIAPLLVSVTLGVGESILFEAALSFLGLGIQPPTPSWGNMLFNALELIYKAPFLAIIPGVLILLVVVSFNFLGDGLQDAIDPKSVRR